MQQEDIPGFLAVERHRSPANEPRISSAVGNSGLQLLKTPPILMHDSPTSHARSWAHLCSQSPGELDPGTSQQPFLAALKVRAGIPKQACLKPCSPWDTFPVPRTAGIFTYWLKSPLGLQQRRHLGSYISSLGQNLAAQTTPGDCFSKYTSLGGQKIVLTKLLPTGKAEAFKL